MGLVQKTHNTITCEAKGCTAQVSWIQEEVGNEAGKLPDTFFHVQVVTVWENDPQSGQPQQVAHTFCSRACVLAWQRDFVPAKSPRQVLQERQTAQKEAALKQAAVNSAAEPAPQTSCEEPPPVEGSFPHQLTEGERFTRKVVPFPLRRVMEEEEAAAEQEAPATSQDESVEFPPPGPQEVA
jgi:hypothetical protein